MTIWKTEHKITDTQVVLMPKGAKILDAQFQGLAHYANLYLWFLCDPSALAEPRTIEIIGTGNPVPQGNLVHISTVQDGRFVWHIFERLE